MSELVVLSLGTGNFSDGFPAVTARLGKPGNLWMQFTGSLPPAPEIPQLYRNWRLLYESLYQHGRGTPIEIAPSGITHISEGAFTDVCLGLENSINTWLSADGFHNIELQLRTQLNPSEPVRVIIESDNDDVWRLPWHLWKFFKEDYHHAEISLCTTEYPPPASLLLQNAKSKVKILAILGNSAGINVKKDRDLLRQLPGVELKLLVSPQRQELNDQLWQQGWDILFFAGHSSSAADATTGRLYINQNNKNNSLTIAELKEALRRAINQGLQLAIFNSCDGLGLARDLAGVKIPLPPMIVMREPVPDLVAQGFLKYFLRAFAYGEPFHQAVRQAREQLKGLEDRFPGASWLPVICQHPYVVPPSWPELSGISSKVPDAKPRGWLLVPSLQVVSRFTATVLLLCIGSYLFIFPRIAVIVNELGLKNHREGQLFMAQSYYRVATLLDPKYAAPYYNLAWLCDESLNDLKCAREAYQQAALRRSSSAHAELARLELLDNDRTAALKTIEEGLSLVERDPVKYNGVKAALLKNRAWLRWQQNRLDEAEADLRSAIALEEDSPHSYCLLAQVLSASGKPEAQLAWQNTLKYSKYRVPEQDNCIYLTHQRLKAQKQQR